MVKTDNKPLTGSEIQNALPSFSKQLEEFKGFKFVALGKTAARACELAGVDFLEMPHPSGMNRKLNDPEYVKEKIKRLAEFIS
jgi:uracil-DNA glycosylase